MATDKSSIARGGKRTERKLRKGTLRVSPPVVKAYNKMLKESRKSGVIQTSGKVTSSGVKSGLKSVSARKQSMPVKGAKNKMKAQGAKTQSMGMQYSRGTRPRGK